VSLRQSSGPACTLNLNGEAVKEAAANKALGSLSRSCLFEWQKIPDGLTQYDWSQSPHLRGTIPTLGEHEFRWRVSTFSRNGTRVTLADETVSLTAVEPPAPEIQLQTTYEVMGDQVLVPITERYLGDALIRSLSTPLDVKVVRDGVTLESETHPPGWGSTSQLYRRLPTDERKLWEKVPFQVSGCFYLLPDVHTVKE